MNDSVPKSVEPVQFRHRGSIGFNVKGLVVVKDFLWPWHSLERHSLTLKTQQRDIIKHKQTQDNILHCLSLAFNSPLETMAATQSRGHKQK